MEKHKELRPGVFGWALGVLPRAHWSFVARAEWELVYVHDVSGIKALGTADQEDVFRDAGFHGDRTTWVGSQIAGRSVNISESFVLLRGGQGLFLRRRDFSGEFQVLDPDSVAQTNTTRGRSWDCLVIKY